jgi:imidazolonepropionase-like amidohydrolase
MRRLGACCALWLTLASVGAAPEPTTAAPASPPGGLKAFVNARLWDGTGRARIEDATLLVRDGRIVAVGPAKTAAVPAGVTPVDLRGQFVTPGFVNAHGHVGETRGLAAGPELYSRENVLDQLRLYARYGVTTVLSLGGDQAEGFRIRSEQGVPDLDRARLYAAGRVVDAKTPAEAREQVAAVAAFAPDFVKIRVDDNLGTTPKMTPKTYRAVIDEAHRRKLRVAVHLFYQADTEGVLAAGADFIAHSVRDREMSPALIRTLREHNVCVSPTLVRELQAFVYGSEPEFFSDPLFLREADPKVMAALRDPARQESVRKSPAAARYAEALDVASRNLKALADAGVPIAFGTDSGPPARFQGYFEHLELRLMVKAGLSPEQALLSATSVAARCIGLEGQVGSLVPGAWADFAVFEKNPLDDIRNTDTLSAVYVAGNRVPPIPGLPKLQVAWSLEGMWRGVAAELGSPVAYATRSNKLVSVELKSGMVTELADFVAPWLRLGTRQGKPMIVAFGMWGRAVTAYTNAGDSLWTHETPDGVDDVWPADLNGDGETEVVVGLNGTGGLEVLGPDGQSRWHDTSIGNVWGVSAGRLADKALRVLAVSPFGEVSVFSADGQRLPDVEVPCAVQAIRVADRPYVGCMRDNQTHVATLDRAGWTTKVGGHPPFPIAAVDGVPWIAVSPSSPNAVFALRASTGHIDGYALDVGRFPEMAWAGPAASPLLLVASEAGLRAYRVRPNPQAHPAP